MLNVSAFYTFTGFSTTNLTVDTRYFGFYNSLNAAMTYIINDATKYGTLIKYTIHAKIFPRADS